MAYREGERYQLQLFPQSIDEYVSVEDPVRAYDAFVEHLDPSELGMILDKHQVGPPAYDPKAMLKLLVYGCAYGIRSSRKLERATHHNLSFIWLMGELKPDHKTIARFRRDNRDVLKNVLKQCVRFCMKMGLIQGNTLFVDGTKIRGNAAIHETWTKKRCAKALARSDKQIEALLQECESTDAEESRGASLVKLEGKLKSREELKAKIEGVLESLKVQGKESINLTDPDCVKVKGRQGTHAGYNGQIVVDEKHGFIVNSDVVAESNDQRQFSSQIEQANEVLGQPCETACGDAGYSSTEELKRIEDQGITVVVPSQRQAHDLPPKPFNKSVFEYDSEGDSYICPEGHQLRPVFSDLDRGHRIYQISKPSLCLSCPHYGVCTKSKQGRRIRRLKNEVFKIALEARYKQPWSQGIYSLRKQRVEHPFGHIKRNLGVQAFLLRGLQGVKAEMSLFASCFNMVRMINLMGVSTLVARLTS